VKKGTHSKKTSGKKEVRQEKKGGEKEKPIAKDLSSGLPAGKVKVVRKRKKTGNVLKVFFKRGYPQRRKDPDPTKGTKHVLAIVKCRG